jgi:hypothetical protein
MLIVVDVWIIYWWCEGNMFADYRHDVCQVQKKNLLLFWACKSRVVTKTLNIVTVIHSPQSLGWVPIHSWTIIHDFYWTFIKHNKNIGFPRHYPTNWKNTYIKYSLSIINYQRSCIQIYTYINLRKSQLHNRIDNN